MAKFENPIAGALVRFEIEKWLVVAGILHREMPGQRIRDLVREGANRADRSLPQLLV